MSKISQSDHDIVRRALTTYERTTGERAAHLIDQIEVADDAADAQAKQDKAAADYKAQAELNRRVEETQQAERQARAGAASGDALQPGNPGAGQEALVTERAKAQGIKAAG